jgi:hypothetical protein
MDIHYTIIAEVDGNEVFNSTYYDTTSLQEDLGKAEGAVEVFIDEINEIEPMEIPDRE